ncbi:YopX family protein [Bacillus subtilis]|uniref:YopX family protein n=1 Tax=Bacillus subtilis TaxID=1423 RepID=UPI0022212966|nr:YopX family protein [Bacillus subtilis]UYU27359.1 hypothetical protein J9312_17185 [Bacillus subtilis]
MNTAYRVWDGEHMHYWDDEGIKLLIEGDKWTLYLEVATGHLLDVADSEDGKSVLMWGTGSKDKKGKDIYQKDITEESYIHPMSKENIIDRYVIERKNGFDRIEHVSGKEGFYRHLWLRTDLFSPLMNLDTY